MPALYSYSLKRNLKLFPLSFKRNPLSFMDQILYKMYKLYKNVYFPSCWYWILPPNHIISCHFSVVDFLWPKERWLSVLAFIFPNMSLFNLIFLLISSIWFSYDPQQLYKVCIYSLLLVSSLLRCLSAEYLPNMIFIWILFSFNLTSGLHDRAALSTYFFLAASEFKVFQSLWKNLKNP